MKLRSRRSLAGTLPLPTPPVRPGSILWLTQQRISPTRQRILLLVTVSEYRGGAGAAIFARDEYTVREHSGSEGPGRVHRTCFRLSGRSSRQGHFRCCWRKPFRCETRRVNPLAVPLCSATVACQVPFSLYTAMRLAARPRIRLFREQCCSSN